MKKHASEIDLHLSRALAWEAKGSPAIDEQLAEGEKFVQGTIKLGAHEKLTRRERGGEATREKRTKAKPC